MFVTQFQVCEVCEKRQILLQVYHTVEPITEAVFSSVPGDPSRDRHLQTFGVPMEPR